MTSLPNLRLTTADPLQLTVDALAVPVFQGGIEAPGAEPALRALGLGEVPRDASFRGKLGEIQSLAAPGLPCGRVVLIGLGRMDELGDEAIRRAAGALTRALRGEVPEMATTLPLVNPSVTTIRAAAEGALLGAYRFGRYQSAPEPMRLRTVQLVVASSLEGAARDAVRRAEVHARAQTAARDLVNTPADDLGPEELARSAVQRCGSSCDVEVWDGARLAEEGCGGILAVGHGAARPPRLAVIRYRPAEPLARVAIAGKGIVFDTGGLNLKRDRRGIARMKGDMAGAAAVIATCSALAELDIRVEVLGICALAENAISERAQRPGDVVTQRNGRTVEVLDTDAEGRLVLADALAYAAEQEPDAIVDLATLTSAVREAVGARATGAFGNDEDLTRQVLGAAEAAGERTWLLPLWDDLMENLESEIADLNNTGDGEHEDRAGATMGALFLREFVDDRPWVHLDISGSAWAATPRHHLPRDGTGVGVRTLLRWLELAGR
ncbi:MAG: leucyl aminopeptidase [Actinomycetota bacterium]|nr:leucyl aminopeptidase [Actinomycetota bacterium]